MSNPDRGAVTLVVGDRALAGLAAYAAERAAGVVRLHPSPRQAARNAARRMARRATGPSTLIDVDRADGRTTVTLRVTIDTHAAVRQVIDGLQRAVADDLTRLAGVTPVVAVHVLDIGAPDRL